MEKYNLIIDAMSNGDFEKIDAFVHEDFMFFKEYEVQNREEWMEDIKKANRKRLDIRSNPTH
jgi:hypothetical protein